MTDRIPLEDLTRNQLAQLYADLDETRELLRDAAGDRDSWATDARRSEAEADTLREERHTYQRAWHSARDRARKERARAEQAEAAIERVRDIHARRTVTFTDGPHDCCDHCMAGDEGHPEFWPCDTIAALDEQPTA